jgi:hypothetical protein
MLCCPSLVLMHLLVIRALVDVTCILELHRKDIFIVRMAQGYKCTPWRPAAATPTKVQLGSVRAL